MNWMSKNLGSGNSVNGCLAVDFMGKDESLPAALQNTGAFAYGSVATSPSPARAALLDCAGRAQRRRRLALPPGGCAKAVLMRDAYAESQAAWRCASLRFPPHSKTLARSPTALLQHLRLQHVRRFWTAPAERSG